MDEPLPSSDRDFRVAVRAHRARARASGHGAGIPAPLHLDAGPAPMTLEQQIFAERNGARPGFEAPLGRGVYFYRDVPQATIRWLVNSAGEVVERSSFRRD